MRKKLQFFILSLFMISTTFFNGIAFGWEDGENFPDTLESYLIQVCTKEETPIGSGFLFVTDKWVYLASAKHVIEGQKEFYLKYKIVNKEIQEMFDAIFYVDSNAEIFRLENSDVGAIRLFRWNGKEIELAKGIRSSQKENKSGTVMVLSKDIVMFFKDIQTTDDVLIGGFPSSLDFPLIKSAYDVNIPLFRSGIVSAKYKKNNTFLTDCFAFPGNSGCPVFIKKNYWHKRSFGICGIIVQYIPYNRVSTDARGRLTNINIQNSGYSVVEPIDKLVELLELAEKN